MTTTDEFSLGTLLSDIGTTVGVTAVDTDADEGWTSSDGMMGRSDVCCTGVVPLVVMGRAGRVGGIAATPKEPEVEVVVEVTAARDAAAAAAEATALLPPLDEPGLPVMLEVRRSLRGFLTRLGMP